MIKLLLILFLSISTAMASFTEPPKLTSAQKNAIVSPAAGTRVYDTNLNLYQYYNGSQWIANTNIQLDYDYSAYVATSGTVSRENVDWISSCTAMSAGATTCTLVSNYFSVAPNCQVTANGAGYVTNISSISTSSITIRIFDPVAGMVGANAPVMLNCQKTGTDYQSTNALVSSTTEALNTTLFTGQVTTTSGAVSGENTEWITSCTAANPTVCTISGFTVAPNCTVSPINTNVFSRINSLTSSSITIQSINASGVDVSSTPFIVSCQKTGADYAAAFNPLMVATLAGTPNVPGSKTKVDTVKINYGTTNATTVCSASPCSYLDQLGSGAVTSVTRSGTGAYTINFPRTYSKLKCTGNVTGAADAMLRPISCTNCASLSFTTYTTAGSAADTYGLLDCTGE